VFVVTEFSAGCFGALDLAAWLRIAWFEIVERRRDPENYAELS
jgi:hypothetical protein